MATGCPSRSAVSIPGWWFCSCSVVVTDAHSYSTMATGGPPLSAVSTGGPHSAMATSGPCCSYWCSLSLDWCSLSLGWWLLMLVCLWDDLQFLNYFANCCFFLSYSTCSVTNPPPVISLLVSNSNHTSAGQVVVNGTGVSFNIAASNPSSGQK